MICDQEDARKFSGEMFFAWVVEGTAITHPRKNVLCVLSVRLCSVMGMIQKSTLASFFLNHAHANYVIAVHPNIASSRSGGGANLIHFLFWACPFLGNRNPCEKNIRCCVDVVRLWTE